VQINALEMTNAYATLADRGERHWATPLLQVRSPGGRLIPGVAASEGKQVVDRNVADLVNDTLQDTLDYGTGASAQIAWPAAGKTGTAQENVDAWFCGYTVQIAACVWVGYPKGQIPLVNIEGVPEVFGGTIPAAIWHDFMVVAMEGLDPIPFEAPNFEDQTVSPSVEATIPVSPVPSPTASAPPSESPAEEPSPEPTDEPSPEPSPSPPSPSPPSKPEDRGG
jgi:membrane peptidoglycan carboxypeptidase